MKPSDRYQNWLEWSDEGRVDFGRAVGVQT